MESGSLGCELADHLKTARLLKHHGKRRCRKGFEERQGKVKTTHVLAELFLMLDGGVVRSATLDRGINENTNGLLRDWLPKGKSLDDATGAEVQKAYDSLNRRPRKLLGWKCLGRSTTTRRCTCSEDSSWKW